jgi:hypothetical protein
VAASGKHLTVRPAAREALAGTTATGRNLGLSIEREDGET